jgi:ABC-2 type transport system permease protein
MRYIKLIVLFFQSSAQEELAYRANIWIHLLHALLNLGSGAAGMWILFRQVQTLRGWDFNRRPGHPRGVPDSRRPARPGVWPSFEALARDGAGSLERQFRFHPAPPAGCPILVSFRRWNLYALLDLALGLAVLGTAAARSGQPLSLPGAAAFLLALLAGLAALYAVLLAFTGMVFWSPAFTFTWVFDAVFQMARYPVDLYPGWLRLVLTWIVPVGLMTTIPARALTQGIPPQTLWASWRGNCLLGFIGLFSLRSAALRQRLFLITQNNRCR